MTINWYNLQLKFFSEKINLDYSSLILSLHNRILSYLILVEESFYVFITVFIKQNLILIVIKMFTFVKVYFEKIIILCTLLELLLKQYETYMFA